MTPAERAREILEGCAHRRIHAGGDGYSGPAYVEEFDGACRACITTALAIRFVPPGTGRDLVDRLLSPISPLTALTTDEWAIAKKALELSLPAIAAALAAQAAQTRTLDEIRQATHTLTIKRMGGGLSGHLIVGGSETICNAGDFDSVSDAEVRGIMLNVLRILSRAALTGAPREPNDDVR